MLLEDLIATDTSGGQGHLNISVTMRDANEYVPRFPQPLYECHVLENSVPPVSIITLSAFDEDAGVHGLRVYGIVAGEPRSPFEITTVADGNGNVVGVLQSTKSLDREVNETFELKVYAADAEGLYGSTVVRIIVDDVNDNDPYFERHFYNMEIRWDAGVGASIGRVVAVDPDACKLDSFFYNVHNYL